ncbi:trichohyalin-like [Poecile atricapillus]|uniref:trichohyalin-like n=1 Tax=Poecile atricapillus TaxID=48891 RepID=UPI00273864D6|nr:trichohyalin-like [Poecile atricapillus]XP_058717493.1 trichohyalin-like [Poecile atricapillus]XP_058717495.1 trichohyalin-like [Poecile atricapillus]
MSRSRWVPGGLTKTIITTVVGYGVEKLVEMIIEESRRRKEKKTTRVLECKIDEAFQELREKIETVQEYFKEFQESRQKEHQLLRAELEKNQGKKEENFARVLLSRTEKEIQVLSKRIKTLQKEVQEWPETTMYELELLRADLEKNQGKEEKEISRALLSRLIWKFQQLFKKIETLEEDLEELLKTSQHEFQLLRADQK